MAVDRKQTPVDKDGSASPPEKKGGLDKSEENLRFPNGVDQGFVHYEE